MKTNALRAATFGLLFAAPFALLELHNTPVTLGNLPYPLFAFLWFIAATAAFTSAPVIQAVRSGAGLRQRPAAFAFCLAILLAASLCWTLLVRDQMGCFLGVPNCD